MATTAAAQKTGDNMPKSKRIAVAFAPNCAVCRIDRG
jgi:hypothetical protein